MPRCIVYARKSSESEERQVLSIDSQIRELQDFARSQKLEIVSVLSESRSAKAPGREIFGQLLELITRRAADGILCWKLDRLARNPVDGGSLIWAFDQGQLTQIVTPQRSFTNTGNDKFWMQLEFGMAKKYVDDLSDNVKRGNRAKLEQGWLPGVPPLGYMNDLATKTIVPDPERFPLVRKMWSLVLAGTAPKKVLAIANDQWGFRTRKTRRIGGRPLVQSTFYDMLSNPFYYGLIVRCGESYPGAHRPMIRKDEFDRVQNLLGRPSRLPLKKHDFAFTGLIRCGECGAAITAEEKNNRYGSRYTYYHCTKRRRGFTCTQGVIQLKHLEDQIVGTLRSIQIGDDYLDWSIRHLRVVHRDETKVRQAADRSLDVAYRECQKKLDTLTDLRLRQLLTNDEYAAKRREIVSEQLRLKERLRDTESRADRWLEFAERAFLFAREAKHRFENGSLEDKREILIALGSNLTLTDKTLQIRVQKPFRLIREGVKAVAAPATQTSGFEPRVRTSRARKNDDGVAAIPSWLAIADRVRIFFIEHPTLIQWPRFCRVRSHSTDCGRSRFQK